MRLVFLGSPPFALAVFERVLASGHEIVALVTQPDRPQGRGRAVAPSALAVLARTHAIPVLQPETTRDPAFVASLRALGADVLLVASYGEILRQELLELAPHGALNVHASLLPRHRGASPIQAAILAGDAETGVSVQKMVLALDEGDVLLEKRTAIPPRETAGELLERLARLGAEAAVEALDRLASGTARFTPQDASRATYARKIEKHQGRIDWSRPAAELERFVRAMTPWPGARTLAPGDRELVVLEIACSELVPNPNRGRAPGTLDVAGGLPRIECRDGLAELVRVKPAGKAEMSGREWLRGARLESGARFT